MIATKKLMLPIRDKKGARRRLEIVLLTVRNYL